MEAHPPALRIRSLTPRPLIRPLLCALAVALLGATAAVAAPQGKQPNPHEPFFPHAGDRSYDAIGYRVRLAYSRDQSIKATMQMQAEALARLKRLSLDLAGLEVSGVEVNGENVPFNRGRDKLVVHPQPAIPKGERFSVTVAYAGQPKSRRPRRLPGGLVPDRRRRRSRSASREGTAAWIPCNNVPADKATFDFRSPSRRAEGGRQRPPADRVAKRGGAHFHWVEAGADEHLPGGARHRPRAGSSRATSAGCPPGRWSTRGWRSTLAGAGGAAGDRPLREPHLRRPTRSPRPARSSTYARKLGYALETQTRPIYAFVPDLTTVVHETAHQWFGDSVGLKRWPEHLAQRGLRDLDRVVLRRAPRRPQRRTRSSAASTACPASNDGVLEPAVGPSRHAEAPLRPLDLRPRRDGPAGAAARRSGPGRCCELLRRWATEHRHGSGSIEEFIRPGRAGLRPRPRRRSSSAGSTSGGSRERAARFAAPGGRAAGAWRAGARLAAPPRRAGGGRRQAARAPSRPSVSRRCRSRSAASPSPPRPPGGAASWSRSATRSSCRPAGELRIELIARRPAVDSRRVPDAAQRRQAADRPTGAAASPSSTGST